MKPLSLLYSFCLLAGFSVVGTIRSPGKDNPQAAPVHVTWRGVARSCAGGIAVDGVHDFAIVGVAKYHDAKVASSIRLTLSFQNNRGHNYNNGDPDIKPQHWTISQIKRAKFVVKDKQGKSTFVEQTTVTTDAAGTFNVHVLSSDIVSHDIRIRVSWTDQTGNHYNVGNKTCTFAKTFGRRGFPDVYDPDQLTDKGQLSTHPNLPHPANKTVAKVYLQYKARLQGEGGAPVWKRVNGHRIKFTIGKITLLRGGQGKPRADYAFLTNSANQELSSIIRTTRNDGSVDGVASVTVESGKKSEAAETINVDGTDLSQWRK